MQNLYLITGCNGAGKTTASYTLLPELLNCKEFVNADEIAKGLSPFQPETVAIEAGRIMLCRIEELLNEKKDFALETTLASKTYIHTIHKAKELNYQVTLVYFWLNTPEQAIDRVKQRVSKGGHNIPEEVIRRRYFAGIKNLMNRYLPVVDNCLIMNNSLDSPTLIAKKKENLLSLHQQSDWDMLLKIASL